MKAKSRLLAVLLVAAVASVFVVPARSYLYNYTIPSGGGTPVPNRWATAPITWRLNSSQGPNITGTRLVDQVITDSFASWTAAPNTSLQVVRGANSSATSQTNPTVDPPMNLICFVCPDTANFADSKTLAVTTTWMQNNGQLIQASILFNPNSQFNTDAGSGNAQDLQTVATHEIGHFFGLGHSAVVRAIMYPYASDLRTLGYDDVAAISTLYPNFSQVGSTGTIAGTVRLNGTAVFGAHVFAESVTTLQSYPASIRKTPIGMLTRPDGSYSISGLPPDSYIVLAEPLDGPIQDSDFGIPPSGYAATFGQPAVQTNFNTRWH
jgi:hypothetical protein